MSLVVALAEAFAGAGFVVLRCDLPFRQIRRFGPPRPGDAIRDRAGLKNAVAAMRTIASGRIFLGGQSYGGRQASMLLAEEAAKQVPRLEGRFASESPRIARNDSLQEMATLADGLLLLSYPLHPPGKPDQLRIQHLPQLHVPTLFVEGTRDPFGSIPEIEAARKLIPARTELLIVEDAGHDLGFKGKAKREDLPTTILRKFIEFFGAAT
jgi:predicted alpha/beta-hydrolase family hydrolase